MPEETVSQAAPALDEPVTAAMMRQILMTVTEDILCYQRKLQNLIIEIVKIRNENVVKFTLHDTSMYIKLSIALYVRSRTLC